MRIIGGKYGGIGTHGLILTVFNVNSLPEMKVVLPREQASTAVMGIAGTVMFYYAVWYGIIYSSTHLLHDNVAVCTVLYCNILIYLCTLSY